MTDPAATLIVLGMHRSGTSLTTGLLQSAGLHIGEALMPASASNPKGHFENVEFYRFHQAVLRSQGVNDDGWTLQDPIAVEEPYIQEAQILIQRQAAAPVWGWKDPRTVLLLDFWSQQLPDSKFLCVYRAPWEVIDSLYRRGDKLFQKQPELAAKVWIHYNRKILDFCKKHADRCLLVHLSTVTTAFPKLIEKLNSKFALNLSSQPETALYQADWLNQKVSDTDYPSQLYHYFPEAIELYEALEKRAWYPKKTRPNNAWRDRAKGEFHQLATFQHWQQMRVLEKTHQALSKQLDAERVQSQKLQQQVQTLSQNPAKADYEALQQRWQDSQTQLTQLQTQYTELEMLTAEQKQQSLEYQAELETLQAQYKTVEAERSHLETELQTQAATQQVRQQELQQKLDASTQQHAHQQSELQALHTRLAEVQIALAQAQTDREAMTTKAQHLQTTLDRTQAELTTTQAALQQSQTELATTQTTLDRTQAELTTTQTWLDQTQAALQQADADATATQIQVDRLQTEVDQLKLEKAELITQHDNLHREQSAAQLEIQDLQGALEQSEGQRHETELALQQVRAEWQEMTTQLQASQTQRQQAEQSIEQLQMQLRQVSVQERSAQAQLHQLESLLKRVQTEGQETQRQVDRLTQELHRAEESGKQAQAQLQTQRLQSQQEQERLYRELAHYRYQAARASFQLSLAESGAALSVASEYQLRVWEAWYAFQQGDSTQMATYLKQALKLTTMPRSELVLSWIRRFEQLSREHHQAFQVDRLVQMPEWQSLMRQLMVKRKLVAKV